MDTYCEYIFQRKKTPRDHLVAAGLIFLAMVLIVTATYLSFAIPTLITYLPLFCFGVIWGAFKITRRSNREYEYLLTGADLDVDEIINKSSRKHVVSIRRREIEVIAAENDKNLPDGWENLPKVELISGYNPHAVYVLVANTKEGRKAFYIEPTQKMLDQYKTKIPGKIFIK